MESLLAIKVFVRTEKCFDEFISPGSRPGPGPGPGPVLALVPVQF